MSTMDFWQKHLPVRLGICRRAVLLVLLSLVLVVDRIRAFAWYPLPQQVRTNTRPRRRRLAQPPLDFRLPHQTTPRAITYDTGLYQSPSSSTNIQDLAREWAWRNRDQEEDHATNDDHSTNNNKNRNNSNLQKRTTTTSSVLQATIVTPQRQRPLLIVGDWQTEPATLGAAINVCKLLAANLAPHHHHSTSPDVQIMVIPPLPFVSHVVDGLQGSGIHVGAHLSSSSDPNWILQVQSVGCDHVLLTLQVDDDEDKSDMVQNLGRQLATCLAHNERLQLVLCVSHSDDLSQVLKQGVVQERDWERISVAVEPASSMSLSEIPEWLEALRVDVFDTDLSTIPRLLLWCRDSNSNTNVSPRTITDYTSLPDIDGMVLDSSLSLSADAFTRIIHGASILPSKLYSQEPQVSASY